MPKEF